MLNMRLRVASAAWARRHKDETQMSEWCDMGTYLERDPADYGQRTIDDACAELDEPTITVRAPSVSITIYHPALAVKGGVVRGYIPLPERWALDDLAEQVPTLIAYGLKDVVLRAMES